MPMNWLNISTNGKSYGIEDGTPPNIVQKGRPPKAGSPKFCFAKTSLMVELLSEIRAPDVRDFALNWDRMLISVLQGDGRKEGKEYAQEVVEKWRELEHGLQNRGGGI